MEVDHGRAARAGAEDKAAAEARIVARRRRRRGVVVAVLIALLVAEPGVIGYRRWFGPPSLAVGTHHVATLRLVPGCPARTIPELDFAGHHWWPEQDPGMRLPVTGTLFIVRRAEPVVIPDPRITTAWLMVGDIEIDLFGGSDRYRPMECGIS